MGILADLLQERFAIKTRNIENPLLAAIAVAGNQILLNEPDRIGFIVINLSVNAVYISPLPTVTALAGIRIDPNGGWRSFVWDEDFELCSHAWYATAAAFPSVIFVTTNIGVK